MLPTIGCLGGSVTLVIGLRSLQHSVDRVVEIAQCGRELAAQVLLASRGDIGLAITRIVEGRLAGEAAAAPATQPQEDEQTAAGGGRELLEFEGLDLDSGAQLSPTLLAQQQAMLVSISTTRRTTILFYCDARSEMVGL